MAIMLDIGQKTLRLAYARGNRVEKWVKLPLPAGMVADGNIMQPEALGKIIAGAVKDAGLPADSVSATLTGLPFSYRLITLPRLKSSQMEEAVLRAAQKEIPVPVEEMYLAWQVTGQTATAVSYFLAGIRRDILDALLRTIAAAGLRLAAFDLKALALARAVNRPRVLVVNFSPDCFDIVLVYEDMPVILHSAVPRVENTELEDNLARLADEIARTVDFYNITHPAQPVAGDIPLVLAGELALVPGVVTRLQEITGFNVEPFLPVSGIAEGFPASDFVANIGLALKGKRSGLLAPGDKTRFMDIEIDFLAAKRRLGKPVTAVRDRILQGALLTAVVLLLAFSLLRNGARAENLRLEGENEALTRELNLARTRADQAALTEAAIIALNAETANMVNQQLHILGKDANHAAMLQTVVDNLPAGVSFTGIELTADDISVNGNAGARDSILDYARRLENFPVFEDVRIAKIEAEGDIFSYEIVLTH